MRKILIVIDMQNDFIDGSLGTREAVGIVENVKKKIASYAPEDVYATRDTHQADYLETQEGRNLPVEHCIEGTDGWKIRDRLFETLYDNHVFNKPTFGSVALAKEMLAIYNYEEAESGIASGSIMEIEIVGLCTDICVVSNALMIKAFLPEVKITVDSSCCAGVTPAKHEAALETMRSCQIDVK